jgi:hypothetical protein
MARGFKGEECPFADMSGLNQGPVTSETDS